MSRYSTQKCEFVISSMFRKLKVERKFFFGRMEERHRENDRVAIEISAPRIIDGRTYVCERKTRRARDREMARENKEARVCGVKSSRSPRISVGSFTEFIFNEVAPRARAGPRKVFGTCHESSVATATLHLEPHSLIRKDVE